MEQTKVVEVLRSESNVSVFFHSDTDFPELMKELYQDISLGLF
jgi:hypothetical protein